MKEYGFDIDATHSAMIYEKGTEAHDNAEKRKTSSPNTEGLIVGSSEWAWLEKDNGRRICAALKYFSETSTEEIIRISNEKFK